MAASRFGKLDGLAYQSPPPSYWSRATVRIGGAARVAVVDAPSVVSVDGDARWNDIRASVDRADNSSANHASSNDPRSIAAPGDVRPSCQVRSAVIPRSPSRSDTPHFVLHPT